MKRLAPMIVGVIGLPIATMSAFARVIPEPCGADVHIQCAVYDSNEVYEIAAAPGRAALIQLEAGESIEDKGAGMGDGKAWSVASNKNWILVKPSAVRPDTNFMVVTNRRLYTFALVTARNKMPTTWVLKFDYPDTRARAVADEERKRARMADIVAGRSKKTNITESAHKNDAYFMRGSIELAPTAAWDNGRFTYFRYATSRDLPKIFTIRADGSEALPNYHIDDDTVVVHETAKQFVIRLGNAVLGIRNDGYAPNGQYNTSGTTVPGMVRLTKEHQ